MIYYEYRPVTIRTGPPRLLTKDDLRGRTGFRSVGGFSQQTKEFIDSQKSMRGLQDYPLYMDHIVLDFDNQPKAHQQAVELCRTKRWKFRSYYTGNRGHHVYVFIQPKHEVGIQRHALSWALQNFYNFDESLFRSTSMTRIPGTTHAKTGRVMSLEESGNGSKPCIKDYIPVIPKMRLAQHSDGVEFICMLHKPKSEGTGRHTFAYTMVEVGARGGLEPSFIVDSVEHWNSTLCSPPLAPAYLQRMYRKVLGV